MMLDNTSESQVHAPIKVSEFSLAKVEGDRFIPMRTINEAEELNEQLDTKMEIEQGAPANLFEESSLESPSNNN